MDEQRLAELERKWLDGTISDPEAAEYAQWYNAGQNNPLEIPETIARSKDEHQLKMLQAIMHKLDDAHQENTKSIPFLKSPFFYPISASILLCLAIGGWWFFQQSTDSVTVQELARDIAPGQSGLVITLKNGKELMIDSIADGLVAVEDGVRIMKKDGAIYYEGSSNTIVYNTATTKRGRKYQLILPDGSKVWLNASSKLKYPLSFSAASREVSIDGEAYFEVAHNSEKPFIIKAGAQEIKVLGTEFNVNNYSDESYVTTTLLQGSVQVTSKDKQLNIQPNQQAISTQQGGIIHVEDVKATEAIGWIKGVFNFNDASLATILKQLERWYDIDILISAGVNRNQVFHGNTSMNQNLSEVLKVLELSGVRMKLEGRTLTILP